MLPALASWHGCSPLSACRGTITAQQRDQLRTLLVAVHKSSEEDDAPTPQDQGIDIVGNGLMHLTSHVARSVPSRCVPGGCENSDTANMTSTQATQVVQNMLQAAGDAVADQLLPHLPGLDATPSALAQLADPLSVNGRNLLKPKPAVPQQEDEVLSGSFLLLWQL